MKRLCLGFLAGLPVLLAGCLPGEPAAPRPRPPIDAAAPARTETATFSLG